MSQKIRDKIVDVIMDAVDADGGLSNSALKYTRLAEVIEKDPLKFVADLLTAAKDNVLDFRMDQQVNMDSRVLGMVPGPGMMTTTIKMTEILPPPPPPCDHRNAAVIDDPPPIHTLLEVQCADCGATWTIHKHKFQVGPWMVSGNPPQ